MALPSVLPNSGSFLGPKMSRASTKMKIISDMPRFPIYTSSSISKYVSILTQSSRFSQADPGGECRQLLVLPPGRPDRSAELVNVPLDFGGIPLECGFGPILNLALLNPA